MPGIMLRFFYYIFFIFTIYPAYSQNSIDELYISEIERVSQLKKKAFFLLNQADSLFNYTPDLGTSFPNTLIINDSMALKAYLGCMVKNI